MPELKKHPRECGEYSFSFLPQKREEETPPRVRGILSTAVPSSTINRNTPASAGNTGFVKAGDIKL